MSGGSFDYLYNRFENENPLDSYTLELLEGMADWLDGQSQHEAADELRTIHKKLSKLANQVNSIATEKHFQELIHAAEWWCSCDVGIESFEQAWKRYKANK